VKGRGGENKKTKIAKLTNKKKKELLCGKGENPAGHALLEGNKTHPPPRSKNAEHFGKTKKVL